jgi:hypothetical protein
MLHEQRQNVIRVTDPRERRAYDALTGTEAAREGYP